MAFPDYWFVGTLKSIGWPRKEGRFLRKTFVVDSNVADRTLDLLILTGILIGADAPEIGTTILVSQFDEKDWKDKNELEGFTSLLHEAANATDPQGNSYVFAKVAPKVPWEFFDHEKFLYTITTRFIGALWLGLTKPQQVAERIDTIGRSQYEDELFRAGLKGSAHSREEMLQAALEIVSAYETEIEKLKDAPPPLLNYINEQRSSEKA